METFILSLIRYTLCPGCARCLGMQWRSLHSPCGHKSSEKDWRAEGTPYAKMLEFSREAEWKRHRRDRRSSGKKAELGGNRAETRPLFCVAATGNQRP